MVKDFYEARHFKSLSAQQVKQLTALRVAVFFSFFIGFLVGTIFCLAFIGGN